MTSKPGVTMWQAPKRRDYAPKPLDPGQRFEWSLTIDGHWSGRAPEGWRDDARDLGTWIPSRTVERSGVIWSAGPVASSLWVRPDDSVGVAAVKLPTAMRAARGDRPAEMTGYGAQWQSGTLRRCAHLSSSGPVLAEIATERRYEYGRGQVESTRIVAYHVDPACRAICNGTRPHREWEPNTGSIIAGMLDQTAVQRGDLCKTCIWLSEPAEVAAAA